MLTGALVVSVTDRNPKVPTTRESKIDEGKIFGKNTNGEDIYITLKDYVK